MCVCVCVCVWVGGWVRVCGWVGACVCVPQVSSMKGHHEIHLGASEHKDQLLM